MVLSSLSVAETSDESVLLVSSKILAQGSSFVVEVVEAAFLQQGTTSSMKVSTPSG